MSELVLRLLFRILEVLGIATFIIHERILEDVVLLFNG